MVAPMSQFEEENALDGERGGEVDDQTMEQAWRNTEELEGEPVPPQLTGDDDDS
jgi:hypothetical protein